jgi:cytochrome b561
MTTHRAGRYDLLARLLHWIFAIGIIYASIVGYALHFIPDGTVHGFFSRLNMSLATVLIALFPIRVWWRFVRTEPTEPLGLSPAQIKLARMIQALIYLTILSVLVSGYLMVPDGYQLFGLANIPTPFAKGMATEDFFILHRLSCAALCGLVGLHLLGVLAHTVVKPNGLLRRMI